MNTEIKKILSHKKWAIIFEDKDAKILDVCQEDILMPRGHLAAAIFDTKEEAEEVLKYNITTNLLDTATEEYRSRYSIREVEIRIPTTETVFNQENLDGAIP